MPVPAGVAPPSALSRAARSGAFHTTIIGGDAAARARAEAELDAAGVPLALAHRAAWGASRRDARSWFVIVRSGDGGAAGHPAAGFAVELSASRALPGHLLARVERLGEGADVDATAAGLRVLAARLRREPRVLRLAVEVVMRDAASRSVLGEALRDVGFVRAKAVRCYEATLAFDLRESEETLWDALPRKTRRDIRLNGKHAVEIRPVADASLAPRLDALMIETMARTGGQYHPVPWTTVIELGRGQPERSNLLGLFRTDVPDGEESLVAFVWACHHGTYAHYDAGASTRATTLRIPLMYALLWEQLRWAKAQGATWFDMGGVSRGTLGDGDDPLGGISDFKRYFTRDLVTVGEDWMLETSPARARVARLLGAGARWVARMRSPAERAS